MPHTPENIIDIGNNIKASNSDAFKVAANRLCNIADDVYRKQVELPKPLTESQKGEIEQLLWEVDNKTLQRKVESQIENELINSVNYKSALNKLQNMKKGRKANG